jgi:butyrate kinase
MEKVMHEPLILVINPGSTSTKLAFYVDERCVLSEQVDHPEGDLASFPDVASQEGYRYSLVMALLRDRGIDPASLDAVSVRGGLMKPVASGVYRVSEAMVKDVRESKARWGREHASNLGPMLGMRLHKEYGMPAFTADPVTVDEMDDLARISGVPEITRKSNLHALNIKAVLRRAAAELGVGLTEKNFVVAHMGGGTSVAAVRRGRIVDVNNALLGMGPFSPLRAGALPIGDLLEIAYSGAYEKGALFKKLAHESGLMGYLGTSDVREVERRIIEGDRYASAVLDAMAYQVAKEIAAMASVLKGEVEAVLLTGGVAHSERFVGMIRERAGFVAKVIVYPGEFEMESLAEYARRSLSGEERIQEYVQD